MTTGCRDGLEAEEEEEMGMRTEGSIQVTVYLKCLLSGSGKEVSCLISHPTTLCQIVTLLLRHVVMLLCCDAVVMVCCYVVMLVRVLHK